MLKKSLGVSPFSHIGSKSQMSKKRAPNARADFFKSAQLFLKFRLVESKIKLTFLVSYSIIYIVRGTEDPTNKPSYPINAICRTDIRRRKLGSPLKAYKFVIGTRRLY